ncbi:hypothetical protein VKT23_009674 [Stygiomarasmius scandens]|uniref:Uncharacterized protein n=1 Tax=Marasmiellus scandens TaxID=2682957 RepID=A0ABR1JDV3_9AGAR
MAPATLVIPEGGFELSRPGNGAGEGNSSAEATPRPKALVPSTISFPPPSPTSSHSASSSYTPHPDHRELHIPTPISTSISNTAGASLASSILTKLTSPDTGPTMNNGSTRPTVASTPIPAAPPSSYEISSNFLDAGPVSVSWGD